jgi:hypothetical protein
LGPFNQSLNFAVCDGFSQLKRRDAGFACIIGCDFTPNRSIQPLYAQIDYAVSGQNMEKNNRWQFTRFEFPLNFVC